MWIIIDKDSEEPSRIGMYKVRYFISDNVPNELAEGEDCWDGSDWDIMGYRQLLHSWFKEDN